MSNAFIYCRIGYIPVADQLAAIRNAGYDTQAATVISEEVPAFAPLARRPALSQLVDSAQAGDVITVATLDCIGGSNADLCQTLTRLAAAGVTVRCPAFPPHDLTSPLFIAMSRVMAELEITPHKERISKAHQRSKAQGTQFGRPAGSQHTAAIQECRASGMSQKETAAHLGIGIATVKRNWHAEG